MPSVRQAALHEHWNYLNSAARNELSSLTQHQRAEILDRTLILLEQLISDLELLIPNLALGTSANPVRIGGTIDDLWDVMSSGWFRSKHDDSMNCARLLLCSVFVVLCRANKDYGPPSLFPWLRYLATAARSHKNVRLAEHASAVLHHGPVTK